jgi:hypothetical protein
MMELAIEQAPDVKARRGTKADGPASTHQRLLLRESGAKEGALEATAF